MNDQASVDAALKFDLDGMVKAPGAKAETLATKSELFCGRRAMRFEYGCLTDGKAAKVAGVTFFVGQTQYHVGVNVLESVDREQAALGRFVQGQTGLIVESVDRHKIFQDFLDSFRLLDAQ